jgi:hypothetical protein
MVGLSVFVDLDGAAHRRHHRTNIVGHIGHAIAGLVVPVAKKRIRAPLRATSSCKSVRGSPKRLMR